MTLIPGIRRWKSSANLANGRTAVTFYYEFNLALLTEEVMRGEPANSGGGKTKSYWTWPDLARLIFDAQDFPRRSTKQKIILVEALRDMLVHSGLNTTAVALSYDDTESGFSSYGRDAKGKRLDATLLNVAEDSVSAFNRKYRKLGADRTYKASFPKKDLYTYLSKFKEDHVDRVKYLNGKLEADLKPVREALMRVHSAHLAVEAMFDFAKSRTERQKLWTVDEPKEDVNVYRSDFTPPKRPTAHQHGNAEVVRDRYLPNLARGLASTLRWLTTGEVENGKYWANAENRNVAARLLLQKLREDQVILTLLEDHEYVEPVLWLTLEIVLLEAFYQLSTCPETLQDLLDSEFMAVARVAASHDIFADSFESTTDRARALQAEIGRFVPANELVEVPTTLSQRLVSLHETSSEWASRGRTFSRIWAAATPSMAERIAKQVAANAGDGKLAARAWVLRSMLGVGSPGEKAQVKAWKQLDLCWSKGDPVQLKKTLAAGGPFQHLHRYVHSSFAWESLSMYVSLLSFGEAMRNLKDDPAYRTLTVLQETIELSKATAEYAASLNESKFFASASVKYGGDFLSKLDKVVESDAFAGIDVFTSILEFQATAVALGEVNLSPVSTRAEKEDAARDLLFAGMSVALAAIGTATGTLPLAGAVLALGTLFFKHRKKWAEFIPGTASLPGVGIYVRGAWEEIKLDKKLMRIVDRSPWQRVMDENLRLIAQSTQDASSDDQGAFWPISPGNPLMYQVAIGVLKRQYGFDHEAAAIIARYGY